MIARLRGRIVALAAALAAAVVTACSSGDGAGPGGAGFTLEASPATVTVQQGSEGVAVLVVRRAAGFSAPVSFAAEGAPAGITTQFLPTQLPAADSLGLLLVRVGTGVTVGSYPITVRATAAGADPQSVQVTVTVAPLPTGSFTVTASSTDLVVRQPLVGAADSVVTTLTVTRLGGFAGPVSLAVSGLPIAITPRIVPAQLAPEETRATITFAVSSSVTPGRYTPTITATGAPAPEVTVPLNLTVNAAQVGVIDFRFCAGAGAPLWFAVQDSGAAWKAVEPIVSVYSFALAGSRGSVAWVQPDTLGGFETRVLHGSAVELQAIGANLCPPTTRAKSAFGSISGAGLDPVTVTIGTATTSFTPTDTIGTRYNVTGIPDGTVDLFAIRGTAGPIFRATRMVQQRFRNIPDGDFIGLIDFRSNEAFDPATPAISLAGLGADQATLTVRLSTANRTLVPALYRDGPTTTARRPAAMIPAGLTIEGDVHHLEAATPDGPSGSRAVTAYATRAADQTLTFGPALNNPAVSVLGSVPYARLQFQLPLQPEYGRAVTATYRQTGSAPRRVTITATAGALGAATRFDYALPDFTAVAGWNSQWAPQSGTRADWTVLGTGWTGLTGILAPPWVDGVTAQAADRKGSVTP